MTSWAQDNARLAGSDSQRRLIRIQKSPEILEENDELRRTLDDFIADFANWDNAARPEYLETARELTEAAHLSLGGAIGTRPLVLDIFAGGGAIPLEALRIGADAFAYDLNPVAALLNKVVLEYVPRYGLTLAEEVRKWGERIRSTAHERLAPFYPIDSNGAVPIAYIWARTVLSEAPGQEKVPVEIPLLRSMWLSKNGERRALRWVRDAEGAVITESVRVKSLDGSLRSIRQPQLEIFSPRNETVVERGTARNGAAVCPVSGFTTSAPRVKAQLDKDSGGADTSRLVAVYVRRNQGRYFRQPTQTDLVSVDRAHDAAARLLRDNPAALPTEVINPVRPYKNSRGLSAVTRIGCRTFNDLYTRRQFLTNHQFFQSLQEIDESPEPYQPDFRKALKATLALAASRMVYQNTSISRWDSSRLTIKGAFSKQALAVVWDFAEANPFSAASADWDGAIDWVAKFIEVSSCISTPGNVAHASATESLLPNDSVAALVTDPPYFAAIPYADLSDFFYVWLRRALSVDYPDLFATPLTEKADELIVTNAQLSREGRAKDSEFFRAGMTRALATARDAVAPDGIGVVVFAEGSTAGWEAMLAAIVDAGWIVTASWPIDTEMANRTRARGAASLQSSVHIICRPRENLDGSLEVTSVGDWRDVLQAMSQRIQQWMLRLTAEGVVGADAIFACLGPALEEYSKYSKVEKANGEHVLLHEYLEQVWSSVAREALATVFSGAEVSGFEADARMTAIWLWTLFANSEGSISLEESSIDFGGDDGNIDEEVSEGATANGVTYAMDFDTARKIAQGLGAHLDQLDTLVEVKGGKARLLPVADRIGFLFANESGPPGTRRQAREQLRLFSEAEVHDQSRTSGSLVVIEPGQTVLDRLHQSMLLFGTDEGGELNRLLVENGVGHDQRFWQLAQSLSALYPSGSDEKRWVDGVLAKKKGLGL